MAWSLPRVRSADAISYGYIGRCISKLSNDNASRLLTFRRLAIRYHLASESSLPMIRSQVLVTEYRQEASRPQSCRQRSSGRTDRGDTPGPASSGTGELT